MILLFFLEKFENILKCYEKESKKGAEIIKKLNEGKHFLNEKWGFYIN